MPVQSGSDDSVCVTVVLAVSDAEDRDPWAMPPLQDAVDVHALEQLFDTSGVKPPRRLQFDYSDSRVTVLHDRSVAVDEIAADD